ncbi:hypothetical protein QBC32DRAFT_348241 [Pseudoneurospora amorphoporcata]|uniref:Uncharacterized protein n=1 Tax=Pseudoneurospora amorphoporcata TaxID=241081 RepID=A0AAN6SE95_9PEZI|nr:hypothetical protein QBC32DRAFT_348241 [Pseudoneurospora amorphoporcata]
MRLGWTHSQACFLFSSLFLGPLFWASFVSHLSLPYRHQLAVEMNGLRTLASKENRHFTFPPDTRYNNAATLEVQPGLDKPEVSYWRTQYVDHLLLAKFLECGGRAFNVPSHDDQKGNKPTHFGTKLVVVAKKGSNYLFTNESVFWDLIRTLNPDPLFNRIFQMHYRTYFEFSGSIANGGIATIRLRAHDFLFMLSIRQHKEHPAFDSRCVASKDADDDQPPQIVEVNYLSDFLEDLKEEACSPLYLPFALSVYSLQCCRNYLHYVEEHLSEVARITCYGRFDNVYGLANGTPTQREKFVQQNRLIAASLNYAALTTRTLNGVEPLWEYLEVMANEISPSAKTQLVVQSTHNILEAIRFLRQEVKAMREAVRYSEIRNRNLASQLSAYLSQRDSETNIEAAIASRDLAKAASEDSSAMKSIAILTMFFLPSTFFAALFAMPSVGWDQPRHFVLYWAFTIPATILTFAIWAALTQRAVLLRWMKMLSSNWPWRFWRGKGSEEGDEEKGKKIV